jgi:predicted enzyme related to lactoylglutathione lyase
MVLRVLREGTDRGGEFSMKAIPLGLRTVIYRVPDLPRAKVWYSAAFGVQPYFDEPFYVGFNVGGFELGLDPDTAGGAAGPGGSVAYWGVANLEAALTQFAQAGAAVKVPAQDVGEGIRVATVADPFGNLIGLIENPHFTAGQ